MTKDDIQKITDEAVSVAAAAVKKSLGNYASHCTDVSRIASVILVQALERAEVRDALLQK